MQRGLNPGGVISTQGECIWLHLNIIGRVLSECSKLFTQVGSCILDETEAKHVLIVVRQVNYAYTTIPTYPSGQIGFILASNGTNTGTVLGKAVREPSDDVQVSCFPPWWLDPSAHCSCDEGPDEVLLTSHSRGGVRPASVCRSSDWTTQENCQLTKPLPQINVSSASAFRCSYIFFTRN